MSKSTTLNHIGGYLSLLADVVRHGFEAPNRFYGDTSDVHCKRTQANLRHDHMIRSATEILPSREFHLVRVGNRSLFNFRDLLLLQFKKLKRNLTTSNYPTRQAELFDIFGEISGLPGIGDSLPLVSIGYVARPVFGLEGIFMTQIVNRLPEWVHRLDDEDEPQQPIISILAPNDPTSPPPSRIKRTGKQDNPATGPT